MGSWGLAATAVPEFVMQRYPRADHTPEVEGSVALQVLRGARNDQTGDNDYRRFGVPHLVLSCVPR
jgi:hypothetical protein